MKKQTKTKKTEEEGEDEGKLGRGTKLSFLVRETFSKRWTEQSNQARK